MLPAAAVDDDDVADDAVALRLDVVPPNVGMELIVGGFHADVENDDTAASLGFGLKVTGCTRSARMAAIVRALTSAVLEAGTAAVAARGMRDGRLRAEWRCCDGGGLTAVVVNTK